MVDLINAFVVLLNYIFIPAFSYGSQLALGALGVSFIYAILRFANFSHGDLMSFGAMMTILFTWLFQSYGISLGFLPTAILALPLAIFATILFSLPVIYLLFRKIQKSLAYKRNIKAELGRQYKSWSSSLEKDKQRIKLLESMEDLPEDLRNSIIELDRKGIEAGEKHLRKLEKYK